MDKYEYTIKSDKIKKLVDRKEYEMAARIADTIDWEKVKNAKMLSAVSVAYEKAGRLPEARDVLLLAYECAPVGRRFLYKLTELAAKQGNFDEAEEYLKEYAEVSPHDPGRLLLRYEIAKNKKEQPETLIMILEAYHKRDFDEKWSYELAELYFNVGKTEQCVKLCDEIVLWFGVGTYVDRALELKQRVMPLSPDQIEKQENREKYLRRLEDVRREFEGDEEPETKQPSQPPQKKKNKPQTLEEQISQALKAETAAEEADGVQEGEQEKKRISPLEELKARHPEIARAHRAENGQRRRGQNKQQPSEWQSAEEEQEQPVRLDEEEQEPIGRADYETGQEQAELTQPAEPAVFSREEERLQTEMETCLAREIETVAMSATIDEAILRETAVSMETMEADENDHSDSSERTKVVFGHFGDQSKPREFVFEAREINRVMLQTGKEPVGQERVTVPAGPAGRTDKAAEIAEAGAAVYEEEVGNRAFKTSRYEQEEENEVTKSSAYEETENIETQVSAYGEEIENWAAETSGDEEEENIAAGASVYREESEYTAAGASAYGEEREYTAAGATAYGEEREQIAAKASVYEREPKSKAAEISGYEEEREQIAARASAYKGRTENTANKTGEYRDAASMPDKGFAYGKQEKAATLAGKAAVNPISVHRKEEQINRREICDHYVLVACEDEEQGLRECVAYIRRMRELLGCPVSQLAKIRGDRLAQKDIRQILKKLEGRDLVVAGMENLPDSILEQMIEVMAEDRTESFIALIGSAAAIYKLRSRMVFFADCRILTCESSERRAEPEVTEEEPETIPQKTDNAFLQQPDEKPNRTLAELVEEALKSCSMDTMLNEREENGVFESTPVEPDDAGTPAVTAAEEIRKRREEKRRRRQASYSLEAELARERSEQETAATAAMDIFPGEQESKIRRPEPTKEKKAEAIPSAETAQRGRRGPASEDSIAVERLTPMEERASHSRTQEKEAWNAEYSNEKKRHGRRRGSADWEKERPNDRNWTEEQAGSEDWDKERLNDRDWDEESADSGDWDEERPDGGNWTEEQAGSGDWDEERPDAGDWAKAQAGREDWDEKRRNDGGWVEESAQSGDWDEEERPDADDWGDERSSQGDWDEEGADADDWDEERASGSDWDEEHSEDGNWVEESADSKGWDEANADSRKQAKPPAPHEKPRRKKTESESKGRKTESRKRSLESETVQKKVPVSEGMPANDFFEFAVDYAHMLDAVIDDMGSLAFYAEIEQYQQDRIPLTEELAQEMIEKAILRAEKRSFKSLFTNRYDKEGYLILREEHFKE